MPQPIINLLKTRPVGRIDNLKTIATALGLELAPKSTRAQIQAEIETYLQKEPDLESKVREIAEEFIMDMKKHKNDADPSLLQDEHTSTLTKSPTYVHTYPSPSSNPTPPNKPTDEPNSQIPLFDVTDNGVSEPENDLKRKLFETEDETDEEKEKKRPRTEINLRDIMDAIERESEARENEKKEHRRLMTKMEEALEKEIIERNEEKNLRLKQQKNFEDALQKIDKTMSNFSIDIQERNNKITNAYKDEVTKGLEKLEQAIHIAITEAVSLIPIPKTAPGTTNTNSPQTEPTNKTDPKPTLHNNTTSHTTKSSEPSNNSNSNSNSNRSNKSNSSSSTTTNISSIFITDSNGKGLIMSQLKPGETTQREFRHTIKDAAKAIPTVEKPNEVKEVIFQVGLK